MQRHQYIGNLVRDPEKLESKKGSAYARFSIAVNTPQGHERRTDYVTVVCFKEPVMKFVLNYLKKGSAVWVEGNVLTASAFKKKDGADGMNLNLTATDVQSFGKAGIVVGDGDAAEPPDGGDDSWNPKKYDAENEELPWG